jgi:alpha-beta hydrolase superfamily lysophospholipase
MAVVNLMTKSTHVGGVTPLDILPFYFAIEPAPTDGRSAFAVATLVAEEDEAGVSVMLEDQNEYTEIFRFSRLGFVKITWSPCGRFLAFVQNSTLMVRSPSGTLQLYSFSEEVQWLGFDQDQRLWCLLGRRLEARLGDQIEITIDSVECAAVSGAVAYCRREDSALCIYLHDRGSTRRLVCLQEFTEQANGELSLHGDYLVAVLRSAAVKGLAQVRILLFDLATGKLETLMDEGVAFGFNGGPAVQAVALKSGEVLAVFEGTTCSQIWLLAPGAPPKPISPAGFEVFEFTVDAHGGRLAMIASDTRSAIGVSERQLLVAQRAGAEWHFLRPVRGIYQMPRWRQDGRLEILCGDEGRWTRGIYDLNEIGTFKYSNSYEGSRVCRGNIEYDWVKLPGPQHHPAAIILLPRLHQQFVAGAQLFFFHHLLFSIARGLAADGYCVVTLNGPGGIGRGRVRREPPGSYFVELESAIQDLAQTLRDEGCHSIGILAGSLAAVPALRLIGPGTRFSACAFLAPLFEASIPVTNPIRHYLLDDPAVEPLSEATAKVTAPLLVVYGARDEVVPQGQITHLCNRAPKHATIKLCVLEHEGHIFKSVRSWRKAQVEIESFFSSHLSIGSASSE